LIYLLFHGKLGRWTSKMVSLIPNFKWVNQPYLKNNFRDWNSLRARLHTHTHVSWLYPKIMKSSPLALQPWVGLGRLLRFPNNIFYGVVLLASTQPTWRSRVSLLVWVVTLDVSGMGGPTSSIRYCQHNSRDHLTT
jgi:hypothetical protein